MLPERRWPAEPDLLPPSCSWPGPHLSLGLRISTDRISEQKYEQILEKSTPARAAWLSTESPTAGARELLGTGGGPWTLSFCVKLTQVENPGRKVVGPQVGSALIVACETLFLHNSKSKVVALCGQSPLERQQALGQRPAEIDLRVVRQPE